MRPDQAFTGGYGPLTAEDVKFSFERFINPDKSGKKVDYASDWAALDHVEVTGPLVGQDHPEGARAGALGHHLGRRLGPHHLEEGLRAARRQIRHHARSAAVPIVLKEWKPREQFVLEINPDYKGPIKPHFQQIIGKPIKEQKTADIAFKAGEIDFERDRARTTRRPSPPCRTPA